MKNRKKIGLIVPTLNAGSGWGKWLEAIDLQDCQPDRKLLVDSASTDDTVKLALQHDFEVIQIQRSEFNHGGTRHMAAEYLDDCDILIYLTQDALLADTTSIGNLVASFDRPEVAIAYGRQLPYPESSAIGAHARLYNYSDQSVLRSKADIPALGFKTIFCSNSFSAYRRESYMALGGFKKDLIFGEDAHLAGRAVLENHAIHYNAQALVYHSHDYTLKEDARRYFDIGVWHVRDSWMLDKFGAISGEGVRFIKSENK